MRSFASFALLLSVAIGAFAAPIQPIDNVVGTIDAQLKAGLKDVGAVAGSLTGDLKISRDIVGTLDGELQGGLKDVGAVAASLTGDLKISRDVVGTIDGQIQGGLKDVGAVAGSLTGGLKISRDELPSLSPVDSVASEAESTLKQVEADLKASAESLKVSRQLSNIQGEVQTVVDEVGTDIGEVTGIHASRAAANQSVPQIWAAMMKEVGPIAEALSFANANNVTEAIAALQKIQAPLTTAITEVRALAGSGLGLAALLKGIEGAVTSDLTTVAKTLAADATVIFKGLANVLKLATGDAKAELSPLVLKTALLLSQYLTIASSVVTGLLAELAPLLLPLLTYLQTLGLSSFIAVLQYGSKL